MSRHLERLLLIDSLLRTTLRPTTVSLAQALEVSERTVRSDLAFLRDRFNAPLEFSRKKGHHYTELEWRLPSISLSQGELFALTLGARMLQSYSGSAYADELRSSIQRLAEQLPEQTWMDLQQITDERIIFRTGAEINLNPEIWNKLVDACQASKRVWITYYTASRDTISERKLDPYLLHPPERIVSKLCYTISERKLDPYLLHLYRGTNPYLIGYCHQRQAIRWFRVDRIKELEVLAERFVRDPNFDAKEHLEMIFQHEVGSVAVTVKIWFDAPTAPYIRERRWHPTQEIEEHSDGSLTLQIVVRGLNDLKRWILGYGKGAIFHATN